MVRKVLVDANVLWSPQQRNLILQIAYQDLIEVFWTDRIIEEWLRNVEEDQRAKSVKGTLPLMRQHFPGSWLPPMEPTPFGGTDRKDRHVAAAAAHVAPSILLTWNLPDFDVDALRPHDVEVLTPDALLVRLFDEKPDAVMETVQEAQANLSMSAPSWDDYMSVLVKNKLLVFVERVSAYAVYQQSGPPEDVDADDVGHDAGSGSGP